ncbi:MAG: hypothetical protein NVS9B14_18580 [Candidatus Acidiferrum sp.]
MQCRDIEAVLENEGFSPLPEAVRTHAASCTACSSLIADFSAILSVAETLPGEVEPPTRVWVALRNQLEAEGIVKFGAGQAIAEPVSWLGNLSRILRGRALATVAVGLVIVVAGVLQLRPHGNSGQTPPSNTFEKATEATTPPFTLNEPLGATGQTLHQEEQDIPMAEPVGTLSNQNVVDAALQQNLKSLNQFIEDCRRRLKQDPNDELAREYLSVAYRQKAELLSAMIDRGRSVN